MKLSSIVPFLILSLLIGATSLKAAPDQANTRFYIMKTNRMLGVAHMTVKRTKNFTGDLALAIRHERKALALYTAKDYPAAIYHSRRCRELRIKIYTDNKIKPPIDAKYTTAEIALASDSPTNEVLDRDLETLLSKDEDFMNGNMEVDIK